LVRALALVEDGSLDMQKRVRRAAKRLRDSEPETFGRLWQLRLGDLPEWLLDGKRTD
jgi:hypothetical protein